MTQKTKKYLATFILDNRGKEDSIDQIIEGVKKEIATIKGEVTAVENLGKKDFARVPDKKITGAIYVQIAFTGPLDSSSHLTERLRLNTNVYRTMIQAV
jgi:small subunit ribosomal protein S6